jgi:hypothetical protein
MDYHKDVLKRFLPLLDRHEAIVPDSSRIQTWKKCNRLFFYQYVINRVPKGNPVYIYFGDAYHRFREVLSKGWFEHASAGGTLETFPDSYLSKAILAALSKYDKGGPEPSKDDRFGFLTKTRLILSCKYAYHHWLKEKKEGQFKVLQTEVASNFRLKDGSIKSFRMDELVEWNGKLWVRDFKASTKQPAYYKYQLPFKDQPYTYVLAAQRHTGRKVEGIIFEQMFNEKSKKGSSDKKEVEILVGPEIHSHIVTFTQSQLEEWEYEQAEINRQILSARIHDIYPMVQDEYQCTRGFSPDEGGKKFGGCPYSELCVSNNQNHMMARILSEFKHYVWDNSKSE